MSKTKKCTQCVEEKSITPEYFRRDSHSKDGFTARCKKCLKLKDKKYISIPENRAKKKVYLKKYNADPKNQTRQSEYQRKYRQEHKIYFEKYFKTHRDKMNGYKLRRKSVKRKLPSSLTAEQWENIKCIFNNQCAYCGKKKPLAQDHFVPLLKGGEYTHNNIIPACKSCNSSKHTKDFFIWYRGFKYYSEQREDKILKYLGYSKGIQQLSLVY